MDRNSNNGKAILFTKNRFPVGLRVLLVDDDRTSLQVWGRMLQACGYEVTKCLRAEDALFMLRTYRSRFDILICDLHMPGMDGFKLLQIVGLEMADLPVIVISSDDDYSTIQKGIINGACDYLVKPIPMEALKMVWKYVFSKRRIKLDQVQQQLWNVGQYGEVHLRLPYRDNQHNIFPLNDGIKRFKRETDGKDEYCEASGDDHHVVLGAKKSRMIWTSDLHEKFVATVNELGLKRAVPKKILERMQAMGVPNLTREKVASHLQKYRLYLQKLKDDAVPQRTEHLAPLRLPPQEVRKNTYPNQLDLLTQLQRARSVRSFQNLAVAVEGYQNKCLTTQMGDDQTPTCEEIWNEIKGSGGQPSVNYRLSTNSNANEIEGRQVLDENVKIDPKSELSGLHMQETPLPDTSSGDFSFFFKNNPLRRSSADCGLLLNEYTLFRDNSEDYTSLWNEICTPSQG